MQFNKFKYLLPHQPSLTQVSLKVIKFISVEISESLWPGSVLMYRCPYFHISLTIVFLKQQLVFQLVFIPRDCSPFSKTARFCSRVSGYRYRTTKMVWSQQIHRMGKTGLWALSDHTRKPRLRLQKCLVSSRHKDAHVEVTKSSGVHGQLLLLVISIIQTEGTWE